MYAITTHNLTKKFKDQTAVNSLNLSIKQGSLFSLLGVNGAGKTTTIKMLSCLTKPTSGDAYLLGDSIISNPLLIKEKISVSPQETAVAPNLSVRENLEFMCGVRGHNRPYSKQKSNEMIESLNMAEIQNQKAKTLSGGWQRRLSIAMALISEPEILFLDEPTLGLDVIARRELWHLITNLKGKITILLTTHYMEEAQALSDYIGVMSKGNLISVGTADELMVKTNTKTFEEAFISLATDGVIS